MKQLRVLGLLIVDYQRRVCLEDRTSNQRQDCKGAEPERKKRHLVLSVAVVVMERNEPPIRQVGKPTVKVLYQAVDLLIVEPYQVGVEAMSKAVNGSADRVPRNKKELLFKSRGVDVERASQEVFCWLRRFSYRLACTQGGGWDALSLVVVFLNNYRGMAQLAARVVWDHEAGSSSLPTPTIEGSHSNTYTG